MNFPHEHTPCNLTFNESNPPKAAVIIASNMIANVFVDNDWLTGKNGHTRRHGYTEMENTNMENTNMETLT